MAICIMFAGIVAGMLSVAWAMSAGFSIALALAFYPLGGLAGTLVFLTLILFQMETEDDCATQSHATPSS